MPGVAWSADGESMVTTDPDALRRLRRDELSASTSFDLSLDKCSVSMVASRLLPREDNLFEANQLGTASHAVLEHLFSLEPDGRTKEEATKIAKRLHDDRDFAITLIDENLTDQIRGLNAGDLNRWYAEIDRRTYGLWDIEDPKTITVHATEMEFGKRFNREIKIGKVPYVGFIDRVRTILDPATGKLEGYFVDDYKFGKWKPGGGKFADDYADQIRIYVRAVQEAEGVTPIGGSLIFATYGKARNIDTSPKAVTATVRQFERAWDRMHKLADENKYPTKVGPLCGWCPLVNSCPAAKAAGKEDLTDTDKDESGRRAVVPGKEKKGIPAVVLGIPTLRPAAAASPVSTAEALTEVAAKRNAAHRNTKPTEKETKTMTSATAPAPRVREGVNSSDDNVEGVLNGRSVTATAVFQMSNLAVKHLSENGQPVNALTVNALAQTFAHIVQEVEFIFSGATSWKSGLNMRIRGALATSVETIPAPWGQDAEAWDAWVTSATNRTKAIAGVAIKLFELGTALPDRPWASLAPTQ